MSSRTTKPPSTRISSGRLHQRVFEATHDGYELRERLLAFDFSPCTICNSCDMADVNLEDCCGSPTPSCGGCLWAQGFIRCP